MIRATLMAATCLFAVAAHAETMTFKGTMTGAQEVPATDSKGTGTADATLDTATRKMTYTVTWKGLTGPATMAHFHGPAAMGKNAGVEVSLGTNPTPPVSGTATLTEDQVKQLMAGDLYANVHTKDHPGGEIRGQMLKQ